MNDDISKLSTHQRFARNGSHGRFLTLQLFSLLYRCVYVLPETGVSSTEKFNLRAEINIMVAENQ